MALLPRRRWTNRLAWAVWAQRRNNKRRQGGGVIPPSGPPWSVQNWTWYSNGAGTGRGGFRDNSVPLPPGGTGWGGTSTLSLRAEGTTAPAPVAPVSGSVNIEDIGGGYLRITPVGSTNFGGSDYDQRPMFYWEADGVSENSVIIDDGVMINSQVKFADQKDGNHVSSTVVQSGSTKSVYKNLFEPGEFLGAVNFPDTNTSDLIFYRELNEQFDAQEAEGIRTRFVSLTGDIPAYGQMVTGLTSGATGFVIRSQWDAGELAGDILYSNVGGTINDPTPTWFIEGETLSWDSGDPALGATTGTGVDSDSGGYYKGLNLKVARFYYDEGGADGKYITTGYQLGLTKIKRGRNNGHGGLTEQIYADRTQLDRKFTWYTQALLTRDSDIDQTNGVYEIWEDSGKYFQGIPFDNRPSTNPSSYDRAVHHIIVNGSQENVNVHAAREVIDNTWKFVYATNAAGDRTFMLPKFKYTENEIIVKNTGVSDIATIEIYAGSTTPIAVETL